MAKLFPVKYAETTDERIVIRVRYLMEEQETLQEETEEMKIHKSRVKILSNFIRRSMGETGMLSLALSNDKTKVLICVFDREATEDNFVHTHFDEDQQLPYILTEEEYVEKIYTQTL